MFKYLYGIARILSADWVKCSLTKMNRVLLDQVGYQRDNPDPGQLTGNLLAGNKTWRKPRLFLWLINSINPGIRIKILPAKPEGSRALDPVK